MYRVEYLFEGQWKTAIEIGSAAIATAEMNRLSRQYITRMHNPDGTYTFTAGE